MLYMAFCLHLLLKGKLIVLFCIIIGMIFIGSKQVACFLEIQSSVGSEGNCLIAKWGIKMSLRKLVSHLLSLSFCSDVFLC